MCSECEVVNREATDQQLDVAVVLATLAARLRDGSDISDKSIEISTLPFRLAIEKAGLSVVIGGAVGQNRCDRLRGVVDRSAVGEIWPIILQ